MKFLIALSILASSAVFAETTERGHWVKCYDTAQGENRDVVYKLKKHHNYIRLVYPENLSQNLVRYDGCLQSDNSTDALGYGIRFCRDEGQRINGLVPIEVSYGQDEDTVYCDKKIWHWLGNNNPDLI